MAKRKAQGITTASLRSAIAKATKAAGAGVGGPAVVRPGIIIGLIINNAANLDAAHGLASRVTADVSKSIGKPLTPALMVIKKDITIGYVDPSPISIQLE